MPIAAMWGTSVGYTESQYSVEIETIDGRIRVISRNTFDHLYCKLDEYTAALKEDCIEFAVNSANDDLFSYPEWYIDAVADGLIYEHCGIGIFSSEDGEIPMSDGSVILRNFKGNLRYMERDRFTKIYDTVNIMH